METGKNKTSENKIAEVCPYCHGRKIVKYGLRKKKHENVQVYFCKHCQKKFTSAITKNKSYPVGVILKSLIYYNRFLNWDNIIDRIKKEYGLKIHFKSVKNWIKEYKDYLPFLRMREFLARKINSGKTRAKDLIFESRLIHGQIYDFKYHRGKFNALIDEDYKNFKLRAIGDFLELIIAECPHQIFKESQARASEFSAQGGSASGGKNIFNLDGVRITRKSNLACDMAKFVMQAVTNNKERHERLQEFMLFCDSVTIAVEIPVLLDGDDIQHYKAMLNFKVPIDLKDGNDVITGHIDLIQLRNGLIHIMDYKPSASKVKPIEQLTIYALALSRLTSLRLYNFKCAWFDEDDYYEFYPLHVVMKKKKKKKTENKFVR